MYQNLVSLLLLITTRRDLLDLKYIYCMIRNKRPVFVFATFCTIIHTPHIVGGPTGFYGHLDVGMCKPPCDFGFIRPRNVRCHQGHWSWSWPVWPLLEGYRVGNPILQETELGEYSSYIVGGVCVFGLRLGDRTQCILPPKHEPNSPPHGVYTVPVSTT